MKKISLLLILIVLCFKGICQYLPGDMRMGLKGRVYYATTTRNDSSLEKDILIFDKQGHIVKCILYDTLNKTGNDFTFQYDGAGKLISYKEYKGKIMQGKTVNVYDNTGKVVLQNVYSYLYGYPNSHFSLKKCSYKYNKAGQPIEVYVDQYGIDKRPYRVFYTYDIKGQKLTEAHTAFAITPALKRTFYYNKHGDMTMLISTGSEIGSLADTTCYKYSNYDKAGNWLKKQEFQVSDGKQDPRDVTTRKITYFKK